MKNFKVFANFMLIPKKDFETKNSFFSFYKAENLYLIVEKK